MRLASFDCGRIGCVEGENIVELIGIGENSEFAHSPMRTLIQKGNWSSLVGSSRGPSVPLAEVVLDPPVPDPSKIFAAPVNYVDHQKEMEQAFQVSGLGLFLKAPSSLVGSGGTLQLPYHDRRFDQEGEFAVIIGKMARNVSVDRALDFVFGYSTLLDITMRGGEDRSTRKSFETFTPMGPWIVTADEFGDPADVDLKCWVNGELRQHANTKDLIWGVAELIAYASSVTTLLPGDVITTGTPAGVGSIFDGDVIEAECSGIGGRLNVKVSAAGATASVTTGGNSGSALVGGSKEKGGNS